MSRKLLNYTIHIFACDNFIFPKDEQEQAVNLSFPSPIWIANLKLVILVWKSYFSDNAIDCPGFVVVVVVVVFVVFLAMTLVNLNHLWHCTLLPRFSTSDIGFDGDVICTSDIGFDEEVIYFWYRCKEIESQCASHDVHPQYKLIGCHGINSITLTRVASWWHTVQYISIHWVE